MAARPVRPQGSFSLAQSFCRPGLWSAGWEPTGRRHGTHVQDVAVRVLEPGPANAGVAQGGDPPLIGLQTREVVLLEGDPLAGQVVDRGVEVVDLPRGERGLGRSRVLAGVD